MYDQFLIASVCLLAIAFTAILICRILRLPSLIGLLIAGLVAGPWGLSVIPANADSVKLLSEIGVILLLFTIGLEFPIQSWTRSIRYILIGGGFQVFATLLLVMFLFQIMGRSLTESILAGILISLSSTAIVLRCLQEHSSLESSHGQFILGVLIFQDLMSVIFLLFLPGLNDAQLNLIDICLRLVKAFSLIVLVLGLATIVVPKLLKLVTHYFSRELFLASVILICLGVGLLSHLLQLSAPLGAFLAGLSISRSEYHYQALHLTTPLRDVFTSFFFLTIGMLVNIQFIWTNGLTILAALLGIGIIKILIVVCVSAYLVLPLRSILISGFALFQIGEFSFLIAQEAFNLKLLSGSDYQYFLAISTASMALTPLLISQSARISDWVCQVFPFLQRKYPETIIKENCFTEHLLIIGFGMAGRWLAKAAQMKGLKYAIIEANPVSVRDESAGGLPIFLGDASNPDMLEKMGVRKANMVMIAISDPQAVHNIVQAVRHINPSVFLVARSNFHSENRRLMQLGADQVVCKELESSHELTKVMLQFYGTEKSQIDNLLSTFVTSGT